jgi:hypothetical protein
MSSYSSFYSTSEDITGISVFGALYYSALLILVIFLILLAVHFTMFPIFALTANEAGIIVLSGTGDREMAYTTIAATPNTPRNSMIPRTTLPDICNYTIGFDIKINATTQTNTQVYPIGIVYRAPLSPKPTPPLPPVIYASARATNLSAVYQNTNIIVWADGTTKDIQVTLITTDENNLIIEKSMDKLITPDSKKPWSRFTIVVADSFVEVYMNGSLKSTLNTPNTLKQITATDFYPPVVGPEVGGITIANMSMWPRILTSKEIRTYEGGPMSS